MTDAAAAERILALRDRLNALVIASTGCANASGEFAKTFTNEAAKALAVAATALAQASLAYAAALDAIPPQSMLAVLAALKTAHGETKH